MALCDCNPGTTSITWRKGLRDCPTVLRLNPIATSLASLKINGKIFAFFRLHLCDQCSYLTGVARKQNICSRKPLSGRKLSGRIKAYLGVSTQYHGYRQLSFHASGKCLAKVSVLDTMFIRTSRLNVFSGTSLYGTFFSCELHGGQNRLTTSTNTVCAGSVLAAVRIRTCARRRPRMLDFEQPIIPLRVYTGVAMPTAMGSSLPGGQTDITTMAMSILDELASPYMKNGTVVEMVPDEMIYMVHPHWYRFPPMNPLWHSLLGFAMVVLGIISVMGNSMVIYIMTTTKSLRTPTNMLVVNLAFSDWCMMAFMMPTMAANCFAETWILGPFMCEVYGMVGSLFGCGAIWSMVMITLDRYNVIVRGVAAAPLTHKKAALMIFFVWFWALSWTLLPFFGWSRYGTLAHAPRTLIRN
ncbi:hypothetical protein HPB49_012504 [Dermacentor silvarum]|uniref:Uncharacterized protein n=1 Tax=Dermacentor silvarum TaxID=543639 RepID=A0ACB8DDA2_DERSI|nr:hypothetical protein HPB49_012504 [Dermacentor silvarum]